MAISTDVYRNLFFAEDHYTGISATGQRMNSTANLQEKYHEEMKRREYEKMKRQEYNQNVGKEYPVTVPFAPLPKTPNLLLLCEDI